MECKLLIKSKKYSDILKIWEPWMIAIEESDINDEKISKLENKSKHICTVLKKIGFTLYLYELIDDYKEEHYIAFKNIRLLLDKVLVTNQVASRKLRFFLQKYENWKGDIFPQFFKKYDQIKIAEWSEQIDSEIEEWSNKKFEFKKMNRKEYWVKITNPKNKNELWNIKGCYAQLLSALNTIKSELPQVNITIIDDIINRCEYGYFLGFLVEKKIQQFEKRHPKMKNNSGATRDQQYLLNRLKKFSTGRERRVYESSKKVFGLTPIVKEKLRRIFEF
jgi:hypothetical protein